MVWELGKTVEWDPGSPWLLLVILIIVLVSGLQALASVTRTMTKKSSPTKSLFCEEEEEEEAVGTAKVTPHCQVNIKIRYNSNCSGLIPVADSVTYR